MHRNLRSPATPAAALRLVLAALILALAAGSWADAAPSVGQRQTAARLIDELRKAAVLFTQGKFEQCGKQVAAVQSEVEELAAENDPEMLKLLGSVHGRLVRAHALLVLEGVELRELKPLAELAGGKPAGPDAPAAGGKVSFKGQVAPLLVAKCGRCHVNNARGEFSMANFTSLMKGTPAGVVLFPGDAAGSRMIEVIESGDMPRGGLKVAADELATLKKWIDEGAKYDGGDPEATLTTLAPGVSSDLPKVAVMQATGKETVSFSRDLAPVISEKCANCHGNGRRPSGRLDLTTFKRTLDGGESGPPVLPGKPAESLLIKKLQGTAGGERMPKDMPPLPTEVIAKFETWIAEGARFDGPDANQHVRDVAAVARAQMSSHEELSAERARRAEEQWRLGLPGVPFEKVETVNYLMLGDMGPNTLKQWGERAEAITPKIATIFDEPADEPLIKGRLTVFLFGQRYDYSEFGKMVEKRQLPRSWRGHWRYNVVDAYTALVPPRRDDYSADVLIAQQLAGVYVASRGKVPDWFSEGSARVVASRLGPDDPRVLKWNEELPRVLGEMKAPADFMTGELAPEDADICSYSFVKFLMEDAKRYRKLLSLVGEGEAFDAAFASVYGAPPGQLTAAWIRKAGRRR